MLPNGRRLGAHLPLGPGMVRAADRAGVIGASAIQVFADNPTAWHRRETPPDELPAFRARLTALDIAPLSIHAPYLVNLAGPDTSTWDRSVAVLANELRVGRDWGASFVNVHVGSHRGTGPDAGAVRLAAGLRMVLDTLDAGDVRGGRDRPGGSGGSAPGPLVVLENGAGGGFGLGSTIEELALIDGAMAGAGIDPERVGFCLDTAHLWGAGYPIGGAAGVDALLAAFDASIGLGRLRMVHLNDSRSEAGSKTDRHEHIGAGRIGHAGLRRFLDHPGLGHVAYFLETPGMDDGYDAVNLGRVLDIAAGRPLADLPPEAFETRGPAGRSAPAGSGHGASDGPEGGP